MTVINLTCDGDQLNVSSMADYVESAWRGHLKLTVACGGGDFCDCLPAGLDPRLAAGSTHSTLNTPHSTLDVLQGRRQQRPPPAPPPLEMCPKVPPAILSSFKPNQIYMFVYIYIYMYIYIYIYIYIYNGTDLMLSFQRGAGEAAPCGC